MIAGIVAAVKKRTAAKLDDDASLLADLNARVEDIGALFDAAVFTLNKARVAADAAEQSLDAAAPAAMADDGAATKYRRQRDTARQCAEAVDVAERAVRTLDGQRIALMRDRAALTEKIDALAKRDAHRKATANLIAATAAADALLADAVDAVADVLAAHDKYQVASAANGQSVPTTFALRAILSQAFCRPALMAKMGTSCELSVALASASGHLRFADVVKHLRPKEEEA